MNEKVKKEQKLSFEKRLEKLENLTIQMEQGDMSLAQMMKTYKEGTKLAMQLEAELEGAKAHMMEVKQGVDGRPEVISSQVSRQEFMMNDPED